ncbi:hypothetical protein O6H91_20G017300 [Diphasiastrum complanatum]|uniref:Uncharacterized protein n=2 Tax=Diphasiastrum complanatum TaxID=34168 RepID=A0ACC2AN99_DIPCM|nr:hypothetical protein O6H91_20G017300 [Diphasiastrum complanatum]KAJ7518970.1 hypothetical protein O6H91_20G017300 [Diphasiastrum complanatum]
MEPGQGRDSAHIVSFVLYSSVLALVKCSLAVQYVVGNEAGWTLPSFGHVNYTTWASNYTFHAGDSLLFNYRSDLHNVLVVEAADYNSCAPSNPIQTYSDGKTVIELPNPGQHNYVCGIPGHCDQGQKLSIMVNAAEGKEPLVPAPASIVPNPPRTPSKAETYKRMSSFTSTATKILGSVMAGCIIFMT